MAPKKTTRSKTRKITRSKASKKGSARSSRKAPGLITPPRLQQIF